MKISPTMTESFSKSFSTEEIEKYLDPKGFINETKNPDYYEDKPLPSNGQQGSETKKHESKEDKKPYAFEYNDPKKEFGFKTKGPEPTRHGDWEHKGRCTDF